MNRLLYALLAAAIGLSACSKKEEPATGPAASTTGAPAMPPSQSAATPNKGKVLQVLQAGTYTYAEVEAEGGQKVWIAGGPLQAKSGDMIQWGDYAVMQNFQSKALNRSFDQILFVQNWGPVGGATTQMAPHGNMAGGMPGVAAGAMAGHPPMGSPAAQAPSAPAAAGNQGQVKSVANAAGYTYLEVSQGGGSVWIAVPETQVKAGDRITWADGMVMRNFEAKSLGRRFDEIVFASGVSVAK